MISRRLLRIKTMQVLYAFHTSDNPTLSKFENELFFSIEKVHLMYHSLLLLLTEIKSYTEERMDISKGKYFPTEEERNPNTRFINNKVITQISWNNQLLHYVNEHKLSWANHSELIRHLYNSIKDSSAFAEYMNAGEPSYKNDKDFVLSLYEFEIANCELLYEILEEQSIYWNDDVEFVINMIIKTIEKFKESDKENAKLLPLYKNDEDIDFVKTLFRKAVLNHKENSDLIMKFTRNWDFDRIAFMDIILMELAITEATELVTVPTKVSFNEYIEISKFYSTDKSSTFINGVLDKIIQYLRSENKIHKTGRGLIGEK